MLEVTIDETGVPKTHFHKEIYEKENRDLFEKSADVNHNSTRIWSSLQPEKSIVCSIDINLFIHIYIYMYVANC